MGCVTPSVKSVADKTLDAQAQIDKLQANLTSEESKKKVDFFNEIDNHLKDANISDAIEKGYNMDIKTEYSSEFSLDKIALVVTDALKTLAAVTAPTSPKPALSAEAISSYTDLVASVAEAAKSSSTSASSMSFSMNRLCPGTYAFLYATSVSIKDEKLFGTEAVTSTAIYYRFMQSIDDIKNDAAFGAALIDAQNFDNMKTLQAGLTSRLSLPITDPQHINIEEWMVLDAQYSKAVDIIQARLKSDGYDTTEKITALANNTTTNTSNLRLTSPSTTSTNRSVVINAIEKLSLLGNKFNKVIEKSNERLTNNYY